MAYLCPSQVPSTEEDLFSVFDEDFAQAVRVPSAGESSWARFDPEDDDEDADDDEGSAVADEEEEEGEEQQGEETDEGEIGAVVAAQPQIPRSVLLSEPRHHSRPPHLQQPLRLCVVVGFRLQGSWQSQDSPTSSPARSGAAWPSTCGSAASA